MRKIQRWLLVGFALLLQLASPAQKTDGWIIQPDSINPASYYGITVANGMVGIVSSPEPFKIKDVVLAGAYDQYGRGRVSNFLRSFNLLNMYLDIDGRRIDANPEHAQCLVYHHI